MGPRITLETEHICEEVPRLGQKTYEATSKWGGGGTIPWAGVPDEMNRRQAGYQHSSAPWLWMQGDQLPHVPVSMSSPSRLTGGLHQGTNLPSYKLLWSGILLQLQEKQWTQRALINMASTLPFQDNLSTMTVFSVTALQHERCWLKIYNTWFTARL